MYFIIFVISLIFFITAICIGGSTIEFKDLSQVNEFTKELHKRTLYASVITGIAIAIAIVPLIDASTFHSIKVKMEDNQNRTYTKTIRESKIFRIKCSDDYYEPSTWYIWILLVVQGVYLMSCIGKTDRKTKEEVKRIKKEEAKKALLVVQQRKAREAETQAIKYVTEHFGKPDKIVHTSSSVLQPDWDRAVFFIFDNELIYYNNIVIHFNELISCEYVDNSIVETKQTGTAITKTSTNTGSMLGRAVVGGMLAGGAGTIIGGVTAKQTGETKIETNSVSITKHDYTILINTKNVRNPLVKIPCGDRQQVVHDIIATLNAAIANQI